MGAVKDAATRLRDRADLLRRIQVLEQEVQECRQLNHRIAELCDAMMELVLPVANRDDDAVQEILERYRRDISEHERLRPPPPAG